MKHSARPETLKAAIALFRYTLFMIGIGLYAAGMYTGIYNIRLFGVVVLFASNVFFGFADGSTRYVYLFFHLSIFTFLIGKPLIECFDGKKWWIDYGTYATAETLNIIMLSLLALRFGAIIGDGIIKRLEQNARLSASRVRRSRVSDEFREAFLKNLRIVSLAAFAVTILASFAVGAEQLVFMQGKTYNEFFLTYESSLPYVVITLASMAKYAVCIALATMPKKKTASVILIIFLLDAVPSLIIGVRNPLILRMIFAIIYFIMRDVAGSEEKWFGYGEKAVLVIGTPALVAALGLYASLRVGKGAKGGFFYYFVRFFYNQGVSFDTIRSIMRILNKLPSGVTKNYTFGMFIDYFAYGSLGNKLFGMPLIGNNNSALKAIYGNDLAHTSYYIINPQQYLKGWGKGSSYIVENFVDAGYAGVIAFGLGMGIILILLTYMLKYKNTLLRTIAMVSLLGLFFIPRAESSSWIVFLVYFQFWALIIAVYLIAALCVKGYSFGKRSAVSGQLVRNTAK